MLEGIRQVIRAMVRCVRKNKTPVLEVCESPMDADSIAIFLGQRLRAGGCEVRFKVVKQPGMQEFHHVYIEVWYPLAGRWLPIDPLQCDEKKFDKRIITKI
jgi:hypothetical protein